MNCPICGLTIVQTGVGRTPSYCSTRCRVAAFRSRNVKPANKPGNEKCNETPANKSDGVL